MKFYKTFRGFSKAKEKLIKAGKAYECLEVNGGWLLYEPTSAQWKSCHNIDKWRGCYSNGTASYTMEAYKADRDAFNKKLDFYKRHGFNITTPLSEIAKAAKADGETEIYRKVCDLMDIIQTGGRCLI